MLDMQQLTGFTVDCALKFRSFVAVKAQLSVLFIICAVLFLFQKAETVQNQSQVLVRVA